MSDSPENLMNKKSHCLGLSEELLEEVHCLGLTEDLIGEVLIECGKLTFLVSPFQNFLAGGHRP